MRGLSPHSSEDCALRSYNSPISTYSKRGVTKPGLNPSEHAIIYFSGTTPQYVEGEYEKGMDKEPIEVEPSEQGAVMDSASRIRFGKIYPVEFNVKVKDIGRVKPEHMSKLLQYWKQEEFPAELEDG